MHPHHPLPPLNRTPSLLLLLLLLPTSVATTPNGTNVLITGATGRTGSRTYLKLKARGFDVRGLVRNTTKAREVLGCGSCDPSEGIFVGDVRNATSIEEAFEGSEVVIILTSASPHMSANGSWYYPNGSAPVDIDWNGLNNQVSMALQKGAQRILLVSSFGTTSPEDPSSPFAIGHMLHYKLLGEASVMASGIPFTIVKPAGLTDTPGGKFKLVSGQRDSCMAEGLMSISREDVAETLVEAIQQPRSQNLRFDLTCDPSQPATGDFTALFESVRSNPF